MEENKIFNEIIEESKNIIDNEDNNELNNDFYLMYYKDITDIQNSKTSHDIYSMLFKNLNNIEYNLVPNIEYYKNQYLFLKSNPKIITKLLIYIHCNSLSYKSEYDVTKTLLYIIKTDDEENTLNKIKINKKEIHSFLSKLKPNKKSKDVYKLDSYFVKSPILELKYLYRGVKPYRDRSNTKQIYEIEKDDFFVLSKYTAWTIFPHVSKSFSGENCCILKLKINKGIYGIFLRLFNIHQDEGEVLLPRMKLKLKNLKNYPQKGYNISKLITIYKFEIVNYIFDS